jgi:hypothetical protein
VNGPAQKAQQIVGAVALSFCLDQLCIRRRGSFRSDSAAQLNSMLGALRFQNIHNGERRICMNETVSRDKMPADYVNDIQVSVERLFTRQYRATLVLALVALVSFFAAYAAITILTPAHINDSLLRRLDASSTSSI